MDAASARFLRLIRLRRADPGHQARPITGRMHPARHDKDVASRQRRSGSRTRYSRRGGPSSGNPGDTGSTVRPVPGHAAGEQPGHAQPQAARRARPAGPERARRDHPNDTAMREHAYAAGESVYDAVDATRTFRVPPTPSTHNLGTTRMSARPEDGVVNEFGRAHDVPNLFVSDGSVMTTGADREPDVDDRRAGPAPGRPYRAAAESGDALVDNWQPGLGPTAIHCHGRSHARAFTTSGCRWKAVFGVAATPACRRVPAATGLDSRRHDDRLPAPHSGQPDRRRLDRPWRR